MYFWLIVYSILSSFSAVNIKIPHTITSSTHIQDQYITRTRLDRLPPSGKPPILDFPTYRTPKLCVDCRYFIKDVYNSNKYGKCLLFTIEDNDSFLVDGIKKDNEHTFCSVARKYENMCGKEGKFYTPLHI